MILNIDEDEIYRIYPTRKNNVYAKSVKKIIPYKDYDYFDVPINVIANNIRIPNDKYYGINFLHILEDKQKQRIEFRYIGGENYEKNIGQILYFMDKFIILTYDCINAQFDNSDINKLEEYLKNNISFFKNLSKYDNFIVDYPTIKIQIDQNGLYEIVSAYYYKIYNKIYNLITNTIDLKECIINYVTETQRMEIIDANVKASGTINNYDFISCRIDGIFENCLFFGSDIENSQLIKCKIHNSDVKKSKIFNSRVESSVLYDCYLMDSYLNGDMIGGVFRSGDLGPYATMDSNVKIVTKYNNFFDTRPENERDDGKNKDMLYKEFGKK